MDIIQQIMIMLLELVGLSHLAVELGLQLPNALVEPYDLELLKILRFLDLFHELSDLGFVLHA